MANYPQGVTSFIPDYQAYQPDFNFTANVLQLKQTQYDQNWQKLNNIYGQILNAPLTHDESAKRRDNTFKRIDFDLKRITGLDLSLEQNVQQAVQLFRPFYEDASLMKDMAFTKNASYEKAFGEGKRYSTDENESSQYWEGGIRAMDYKIQEFKETPYDQLPGFEDIKYTPYVNVEMKAMELAKKMNYTIDKTTPNGPWIIREQNGEQIVAPLEAIFYSALGEDPKVQEFYATRAYLQRKNYVAGNKDNPEFNGDPILAEKKYLNDTLQVMKDQTLMTRGQIVDQKLANENIIKELESSLKNGDGDDNTQASLDKYKKANADLDKMLGGVDKDLALVTDNINRTATSNGGSKLSMDDIDNMRFRIDNVVSSNLLQADLSDAARRYAYMNYKFDIEANPYEVQKQKYNYDSALINQRANAQMAVAQFKANLQEAKEMEDQMKKSGLYEKNPITGKLEMKPELAFIQQASDLIAKSKGTDPAKLQKKLADMYVNDADAAKTYISSTLKTLKDAGFISNKAIMNILDEDVYAGFDSNTIMEWLDSSEGRAKDNYSQNKVMELAGMKPKAKKGKVPDKVKAALIRQGLYATKVEKEEAKKSGDQVLSQYADAAIEEFNTKGVKSAAPGYISRIANQTLAELEKLKDIPSLKNNPVIDNLTNVSWNLNDYAENQKAIDKRKAQLKQDVVNKMKKEGYNYAEYLFDAQNNYIGNNKELFMRNVMANAPDQVYHQGFSFQDYLNNIINMTAVGASAGAPFAAVGAVPGAVIGFGVGVLGYPAIKGVQQIGADIYDYFNDDFWDAYSDEITFKDGKSEYFTGTSNVGQEFNGMNELYRDFIDKGDILPNPVGIAGGSSTGTYTMAGARMEIQPGIISPTYQTFQELNNVLKTVNVDSDADGAYVSLEGVDNKAVFEDMDSDDLEANKAVWKTIYSDVVEKMKKKDSKLGKVDVDFTPIAGEDANKAGVRIKLSPEYLEQYKPKKGEKGLLDETMYKNLLSNGLSIILNADKLANTTLYKNSFMSPQQIAVQNSGAKGITYKHPMYTDYSINFKMTGDDGVVVTQSYPVYQGPGQKDKIYTQKDIISLQTLNVQLARDRFFKESAVNNDYANSQLKIGNGRE